MKTLIAALATLVATSFAAQADTFQVGKALLTTNGQAVTYVSQNSAKGAALLGKVTPVIVAPEALSAAAAGASTASKVIPVVGWIAAIGLEGYLYTKEDGIAYWAVYSEDHLGDVSSVYNSAVDTTSSAAMSAYNYVSSIDYTFWN